MFIVGPGPGEYDYYKTDKYNMDVILADDGSNTDYSVYDFIKETSRFGRVYVYEKPDMDDIDDHNANIIVKYCLDIERETKIWIHKKEPWNEYGDLYPRDIAFMGTVRFAPNYDTVNIKDNIYRVYQFEILEEEKNG